MSNPVQVFAGTIQSGSATGISIGNPLQLNMGAGALPGDLIAGQALTYTGTNALTLGGVISGNGGLTVSTVGGATPTLTLQGSASNSYSGFTTVNGGTLTMGMIGTVVAIAGPVVIANGTLAEANTANAVTVTNPFLAAASPNTAPNIQIDSGGTFTMVNNSAATINGLTFINGGTVNTGTGTLTLNGDVATLSTNGSPSTATLSGNLSINQGAGLFNIASSGNAVGTPDLNVAAVVISTAIGNGLVKENSGTMTLAGSAANPLSGPTTVDGGTLLLSMTAPVAAYGGALVVNAFPGFNTSTVKVTTNNAQLNANGPVFVNGVITGLDTSGSSAAQSITTMDLRGGTVTTGAQTINLGGALTGQPYAATSGTVSGKLAVAATQIVAAGDLLVGSTTTPGLIIKASISGVGGITKQATGTVVFQNTASNTFTGITTVNEGTVLLSPVGDVNAVQTLTFATASGTIASGTFTLTLGGATTTAITFTTAGTNFASLVANVQAALNNLSTIQNNNTTVAFSTLNGTNPVLTVAFKNQLGDVPVAAMTRSSSLSGGSSPTLNAPATTTTGVQIVAVPGTLTIGDGQGGQGAVKADVVRETVTNAISGSGASGFVTINNSGLFDLNNNYQTLSSSGNGGFGLAMQGGSLTTGTGILTLNATNVQSQSNSADLTAATITGNVALGLASSNQAISIDVQAATVPLLTAQGLPISDMIISALIVGSGNNGSNAVTFGFTKVDGGTLQLTSNNTYTGPTTVNGGVLQVDGSQTLSPVTVNANQSGGGAAGSAVLSGTGTLGAITVTNGGAINPGDPATGVGILNAASLNLSGSGSPTPKGGILQIEIGVPLVGTPVAGVNYDQISLSGALTIDTTSTIQLDLNGLGQDIPPPGINVVLWGSKVGPVTFTNVTTINNPLLFQPIVIDPAGAVTVILSAPATHFTFVGVPGTPTAGVSFPFTVTAEDQFNNQAFAYEGTVQFSCFGSQRPGPSCLGRPPWSPAPGFSRPR